MVIFHPFIIFKKLWKKYRYLFRKPLYLYIREKFTIEREGELWIHFESLNNFIGLIKGF